MFRDAYSLPLRPQRRMSALSLLSFFLVLVPTDLWAQLPDPGAVRFQIALRQRVQRDGVGICVALSGGGMRAAAFHAGVLATIDDFSQRSSLFGRNLDLDGIDVISAVSGGAITAALYAHTHKGKWMSTGVPRLRAFLQSRPIANTVFRYVLGLFLGERGFDQRIEHFVKTMDDTLFQRATFGQLPDKPHLVLISKNFKNGRDVRLTQISMRDHPDFALALAVGASSAIPLIFNPVLVDKIVVHSEDMEAGPQVRGDRTPLFDGGIHDNLALDPLLRWASDKQPQKRLCDVVFASDATEIPFDKEVAEVTRLVDVGLRAVGLLMARVGSLQGSLIEGSGSMKDRIFVVKMPARFNGIAATEDVTVEQMNDLIDTGKQATADVVGDGARLIQVMERARKERSWRRAP